MNNDSKVLLVLSALKKGSYTATQIRDMVGISVANASKHLKRLKFKRKVHISAWIKPERSPRFAAIWSLGYGEDAKKPVITEAMRKKARLATQKRYREREKAEHVRSVERSNVRLTHPQNPFSALFT